MLSMPMSMEGMGQQILDLVEAVEGGEEVVEEDSEEVLVMELVVDVVGDLEEVVEAGA